MTPLVDQPLRGRVARETIWVGEVAEAQATGDRAGT